MREWIVCDGCGCHLSWHGAGDRPTRCAVCLHLGDRSIVQLLRDPSEERLARFRAAPPGWLRAQRESGSAVLPREYEVREDPNHEEEVSE